MVLKKAKRLWDRVKNGANPLGSEETPQSQLKIIPRDNHPISRKDISSPALKVLYRLNNADYQAYLVGGGVRDLLLGLHPKDFDIATDAHPEEVHGLFKNSRLIGRRFKLVHVLFGREVIEVATFRGHHEAPALSANESKSSEHGMLLRDNVYGTMEEDALRRDFTVNALYYCVKDFTIYDYANGLEDIRKRELRLIGDPETRYREDPVRMLRAVRFAVKLDFTIAAETEKPIFELASLLGNIPAARLFDEVLKLMLSGKALTTFRMLRHYNLFGQLFPGPERSLNQGPERYLRLIEQALVNTDTRIKQKKPVTPAFLYASLLWPALEDQWEKNKGNGTPPFPALQQAAQKVINIQCKSTSIPKRFSLNMKEIWELQLRLPRRSGNKAAQMISHPRFRAAYDFLLLREESGENLDGLGQWWTDYQASDENAQRKMSNSAKHPGPRPRRRKKRYSGSPPSSNR
ncbi:polynucleotide adenylyltransferase PcnB [Alkalimarinus sediminis]|uniref:Poly(A) polymerase I n=1 Tax=Alkalimarinus sediminis TaxID=1632866 RepID=A0A9E8HRX0_9ALTE|nr:polynucleotide adenylyltransferase PcnB [Alkalimarinus sediminis]UZW75356.1 polynucleotide adenylyltransferase PcnB [Alkalimarinus sediminis]